MSDTPKVSVIMPVYQVEAYVEDSIRSVTSQTLRELEIIAVNDRSPDGSQKIIDRLCKEDFRIRRISMNENSGQGIARNVGLDAARGRYVFFLDSDDLLADPAVLEDCYRAAEAEQADLVRVQKSVFLDGSSPLLSRTDPLEVQFSQEELIEHPLGTPRLLRSWHFWNYLYSRQLLEKNKIRFATPQWEERYFICKSLKHASRLKILPRPGVRYRRREASTTTRIRTQGDLLLMLEAIEGVAREFPRGRTGTILAVQYGSFFVGDTAWSRRLRSEIRDGNAGVLARVSQVFGKFDITHDEVVSETPIALENLDRAASTALFLSAARAQRWDLVRTAAEMAPISQSDLYREYRLPPADALGADVESATNFYARNGNARRSRRLGRRGSKPPRLVLHIGATKTGSTVIQHLMEINRPALLRAGVWYPEVGLFWQKPRPHKQAGHAPFTQAAVRSDPKLRTYLDSGLRALDGRVHTIVLSSEAFFLQENSHQIARYLADYPCEVIVYLRRQDEWANSQYCEFVGGGAVNRVSEPIETWLETEETRSRMDYLTTLARFETVVPRDRIKVRVFDRARLRDGDVIADFAEAADLPILRELPRPEGRLANDVRLSGAHIQLLRHYNALHFGARDDYFRFIEDVGNEIAAWRQARGMPIPKPMLLTPAQRGAILDAARASNERIARDWLGREDGQLFDETIADTADPADAVHGEEIEIVQAAFGRWSRTGPAPVEGQPASGAERTPETSSRPSLSDQYRVVNYGLFGWRRWGLTPFVRAQVRKKGSAEDLERFDRDPAGYLHGLQNADYQRLARRLYPERSVLGPGDVFGLWVPPLSWAAAKLGLTRCEAGLRNDPVLFVRQARNPLYRAVGRVFFPIGEVVAVHHEDDHENCGR